MITSIKISASSRIIFFILCSLIFFFNLPNKSYPQQIKNTKKLSTENNIKKAENLPEPKSKEIQNQIIKKRAIIKTKTIQIRDLSEDQSSFAISGKWLVQLTDEKIRRVSQLDDSKWQLVNVPGKLEKQGYKNWDGYAWFKISVSFPASVIYQNIAICLGRIGDVDEVFLDGHLVGKTGSFPPRFNPNWRKERIYQIPAGLIHPKKTQELYVRIYNDSGAGGFLDGPVEISLFKAAWQRFFFSEGSKLLLIAFLICLMIVFSFFYFNRSQDKDALLIIIGSFFYSNYLLLTNNLVDPLATSQLIRLKLTSFTLILIPISIKSFFFYFLKKKIQVHFWVYSGLSIILIFIILLSNQFQTILFIIRKVYPFLIVYPLAYLSYILFTEYKNYKNEITSMLFILGLNLIFAISDYQKFEGRWYLPDLSPFGFTLFFITGSVLLVQRIFAERKKLENLNVELEFAAIQTISKKNITKAQWKIDTELSIQIKDKLLEKRAMQIPNFKTEIFSKPVKDIGRDYIDIFPLSSGKISAVFCDLKFTGISSSLMATWLRINNENFVKKRISIHRIHEKLNELFSTKSSKNSFSGIVVLFDPKKKLIQIINKSFPWPLLYNGSQNTIMEARPQETSATNGDTKEKSKKTDIKNLKSSKGKSFKKEITRRSKGKTVNKELGNVLYEFSMNKGDRLICYSPGISNISTMTDYEQFGIKRIKDFFLATKKISIADLGEIMFAELSSFLEGKKQQEDWTLLVIDAM